MEKLEIIDKINIHKGKKFLQVDEKPEEDEMYIAYTTKPKSYIKLANSGYTTLKGRSVPIFQGFVNGQTSVIFESGSRGSGKTLMASIIAEEYKKLNPKNRIWYVCSTSASHDCNLNELSYIKDFDIGSLNEFKILDRKIDGDITEEHKDADAIFKKYNNGLFIFDDIDSLNKETQHRVQSLFNLLLELSRKRGISVLKVSHYESNGSMSRLLNREMDYYICWNQNLKMNRLLNHYHKFNTNLINDDETYLIFDFKHKYVITNKRIFTYE